MKKTVVFFLFSLLLLNIFAQDDEYETIFGRSVHHVGGFGGPMMSFSTINGEFAHFMGGGGGVIIGRQLILGGYGMGMTTRIESTKSNSSPMEVNFGHGGFIYGLVIKPTSALHPAVTVQSGWGTVSLSDDNLNLPSDLKDEVFVLNPIVELEMNITKFFKIGIGGNYRFVFGVDNIDGFGNEDFSGPGGFVSFKFGWFD